MNQAALKMVLEYRKTSLKLTLLLLLVALLTRGQQVGVSLKLRGVTIPNNSLVDVDDIYSATPDGLNQDPSNNNVKVHDQALLCLTDLENCCKSPRQVHGDWYYPDGRVVQYNIDARSNAFQRNRGSNQNIQGRQFYGSVRLWRRNSPTESGRFRCELPSAADSSVSLTLYVYIKYLSIETVNISRSPTNSSSASAGDIFSLTCSATISDDLLPSEAQAPTFRWFFGPRGNTMLPSGVTSMRTILSSGNSYTSTLQFSPLSQSHAGMYTCHPGAKRFAKSVNVIVNAPPITVLVTANLNESLMVGQIGYTLTCDVSGAEMLNRTLTYQWIRNSGTTWMPVTVGTSLSSLTLPPLTLSHAGPYSCSVTMISTLLNNPESANDTQNVTIQIPDPQSVAVTSSRGNVILEGSDVTLNCSIQMNSSVTDSEVSLLMVEAQLIKPSGRILNLSNPTISGTTFTFITEVKSFSDSDIGNYTCSATVRSRPSSSYLTESDELSGRIELGIGISFTTDNSGNVYSSTYKIPSTTGNDGNTYSTTYEIPSTTGNNNGIIAGGVIVVITVTLVVGVALAVIFWFLRGRHSEWAPGKSLRHSPVPTAYSRQLDHMKNICKPKIAKFPSDTTVTEGEGVYFNVKVSGEPQPIVTWYHNGEPVRADYSHEIEADGSLAIPSTELKHSGIYKAVVANEYGSEEREVKLTVYEEGGTQSMDTAISRHAVSSRPIPIPEFGKYVAELHANSNQAFKDLYQALDTGEVGHSVKYATSCETRPLNRFGNIVVYDDNRIVLKPLADVSDCQRDYINASYVDGYSVPNKFIATQGPLPKTVVDFWRLIWQEHPPTIVMVTNLVEGSHIKCEQYWPETGGKDFGPFQVTITDEQIFADYTIRTLSVSLGSGRSHKMTQYHFTAWPDHGVPEYATSILAFHRRVKVQHHPSRGPMVVHCSAGVGRTGTFIAIDNILEQIEKQNMVDIPKAITKIRQRRMKMVQTRDQFTFIHDVILESVTCGDTQISAANLRPKITKMDKDDNYNEPRGFKYQFEILEQVSPNPEEVECAGALSFPERSRRDEFLPADRWRVVLKGEQPDYIHAVNINGYKHKKAFIVAEGPMQSTVRNFWKMIYECNCAVVVMTSGLVEGGQEASAQYWPDRGIAHCGEFAIDMLQEEQLQGFTIRNLSVTDTKTQKAHKVTQFHITCWRPDGHCSNLKSVTDVIEEMTKVQIRSGNKPIVVHCSDTVTRSGMFCAITTIIERCKTEGVVDVFQVVKALRVQKPGAVPTVENYKLIFNAVLVYLESFDTYANFQNI